MERTNIVAGWIGGQNLDALLFQPRPGLGPRNSRDGRMEASPSGRTNGLRIPWIDRTIQDDHGVHAEGSGRPNERSQVAGVLQPIQKQQRRRLALAELAEMESRLRADAEDALRVLRGRELVHVGIVHLFGLRPPPGKGGGEGSPGRGTEQSRRLNRKADVRT